jgi:dipeptidyl aminopeptidase/acylaminoacyl peptidase
MKSFFYALLAIISMLCLSSALKQDPIKREIKRYTAQQFLDTQSFIGGSFNADETKIYYTSDASGVFNIYARDISTGTVEQLTYSKDKAYLFIDTFLNDNRLLFSADGNGDELSHIWMRDVDGAVRDLTPFPKAHCEFYKWSHNKDRFYFGCNSRDPRFMDLYEIETATLEPKLILENTIGWDFGTISPDNRLVALSKEHSAASRDLYLYNIEEKTLSLLIPHDNDTINSPSEFSKDSRELYFMTDQGRDFGYLKKYRINDQSIETAYTFDWDIVGFYISHHGRYHTVLINADSQSKLVIYDQETQDRVELPAFPVGDIQWVDISRSEKQMIVSVNGSKAPTNLFLYDFESKNCQQLTQSLSKSIDPDDLVQAEIIRYRSYDGKEIPALFYKPKLTIASGKVPALIWVHGGPGGQSTDNYSYLIQYLVNHGYAILAVNNRGSSGYGKEFFRAADRLHGEADLDDCVAAKQFLASTGIIDSDKIGIIGGSYGGYMTLAALAFRSNAMAVGIDIFGVSNWIRTLSSIPDWWEVHRNTLYQKIGNPVDDYDYLHSISPLFHANKICKPLLVIQGANDPRVLKIESDQIVEAVINNKIPCEYVIFDDEGHGFMKKSNRQKAAESILQFLNTYLPTAANEK